MSTARWSLRLPRAHAALSPLGQPPRHALKQCAPQRRWLQKPPVRSRPWAQRLTNNGDHNEAFVRRMQLQSEKPQAQPQAGRNAQLATTLAESDTSDLVSEVRIPDDPDGVLPPDHPALSILGNSSLVIQRQLEMMNVMLGFEQANKYIIMNGQGQTIGYIAERDHGIGSTLARQMFRTHRSFTTHIFDAQEKEVLRIHRPFAYINSRIRIYDPVPEGGYESMDTSTALQETSAASVMNQGAVAQISQLKLEDMRIIGEAQQQWAPLRRKYNLFSYRPLIAMSEEKIPRVESGGKATSETMALTEAKAPRQAIEAGMMQFAHVNEPFLSWDFTLRAEDGNLVGSVNRNFVGFAREIFTDTGVYALRMDSAAQSSVLEGVGGDQIQKYDRNATAMTLDQRAVMLATAVSIDFDYFSRHSGRGGFWPFFIPMGGGAAEGGAAGAGAGAGAGAVGSAAETGAVVGASEGAVTGVAGAAGRGLGTTATESGIAGAGTMAGYEAMQRGVYGRGGQEDDASPTIQEPENHIAQQQPDGGEKSWWGDDEDPWGKGGPGDGPPPSAGGEGGEGGGGWSDVLSDFFGD